MTLAATFYGGINIGADTVAKQFLDEQLRRTPVDAALFPSSSNVAPTQFTAVRNSILGIDGVKTAEPYSMMTGQAYFGSDTNDRNYTLIHGISPGSVVYDDIAIVGKPSLDLNETYLVRDSPAATGVAQGEQIELTLVSYSSPFVTSKNLTLVFTVAGFVDIGETAQAILVGGFGGGFFEGSISVGPYAQNTLLVGWDTLSVLVEKVQNEQSAYSGISGSMRVNVFLDRDRLINVFDVGASASSIQDVIDRVENVARGQGFYVSNYVVAVLGALGLPSFILRVFYIIVSLPVFFISWYMGGTVSQSSLNLRRREIGLLLTKGATKGQLVRIFLGEALLIGILGGVAGIGLAVLLNPVFVQVFSGESLGAAFLTRETAIGTVIFAVILTLLAIFRPARRAASLKPIDALREYVYVEEAKGYKQTGPVIAFALGLYKIVLLLLGINFVTITQSLGQVQSALAVIGLIVWTFLDFVLTFIGPFLFFWGASRIFAGGSARFQAFITRVGHRILGELSQVASKNVYRNPARVASVTFLLALIVGYGVWVTGFFASIEDHSVRQAFVGVGADLSAQTPDYSSGLALASQLSQWPNVTAASIEVRSFSSSTSIRAIDPETWRSAAYYEREWFLGQGEDAIFNALGSDNETIIIERGLATRLQLSVGSFYSLSDSFGQFHSMRIVGFFGPDTTQASGLLGIGSPGFFVQGWSYVSLDFWLGEGQSGETRVLVKKTPGVNGTELGQSIEAQPSVSLVSVAEEQMNLGAGSNPFQGVLNVFRLGTVFAGLAASVGVGTVTYTSFREREKETTIMAVRGVSYRQLLGILLMESLPIIMFAIGLGTIVGVINIYGNAVAFNNLFLGQSFQEALIPYRLVIPPWVQLTLAIIFGSILFSVILPALLEARKTSEKMTRMVRRG